MYHNNTPKKKILHVIQSLGNGGCENMLLRTLPLLSDGFEHHVIALRELGELAPRFAEKGIPVTTVHWSGFLDIAGYRRLLSETRQFAPETIITYLFHADMIGRLFLQPALSLRAKRGNPVPVIPFLRTTYNHPKYLIARLLEKVTRCFVPRYLANSEAVKSFYVSEIGVPAEKITVIPNGIDIDFFDSITPNPSLRESLGIDPDDFVVICVANLHPNKGHRYLLEAFEQLYCHPEHSEGSRSHSRNLKLLLVGEGTERKNLEQQIESYQSKENISLLGRRTDVPQLLKISDCFVLPTIFEGMSNALLEAMASGLPVITTNIPENRELVEHEKTGILVPEKDSPSLAKAMKRLTVNPAFREHLGDATRTSVKNYFDLPVVIEKMRKFLETI